MKVDPGNRVDFFCYYALRNIRLHKNFAGDIPYFSRLRGILE